MKFIRIYQEGNYQIGDTIELNTSAAQHIATVLRMKVNDLFILFSGDNKEYLARLLSVERKKVCAEIIESSIVSRESPLQIHLGQAISKGERMEFVVQKGVELGVASITPLISDRSVVRLSEDRLEKKLKQWQAIIIAACEQCGRNFIPKLNKPQTVANFIANKAKLDKFFLHTQNAKSLSSFELHAEEIALIIGPEGGFSEAELNLAIEKNCHPLLMGPRILRTETATIVALSILQAKYGDLTSTV